jgi:2-phosphosulfolactate phosphatase
MNGVDKIIPVETLEEAKAYKARGYLVAAERDGIVMDFADLGNSPFNFTPAVVKNKTIVYSTTNGTQAIQLAKGCTNVIIGSFLNLAASCNWLKIQRKNIVILCAGWKNRFNLEDTLHAGAIVEQILKDEHFYTICDSAHASLDLWRLAKKDLVKYIQKTAQRERLRKNKLDDVIEYCLTPDITDVIPCLHENYIVLLNTSN